MPQTPYYPTVSAGSFGKDYSANAPTLPTLGANFGGTGPYANYVLVATAPSNTARKWIECQNVSGAQLALVRDDGTALTGTALQNASVFSLAAGAGAGAQGGAWYSGSFKGRLQIFAASSSAQVCLMVD